MLACRAIDPAPATHYRSKRISLVNGQYFFSTREGTFEGPFSSSDDAEREIALYIRRTRQGSDIVASRL
jgi:hypothetical protein